MPTWRAEAGTCSIHCTARVAMRGTLDSAPPKRPRKRRKASPARPRGAAPAPIPCDENLAGGGPEHALCGEIAPPILEDSTLEAAAELEVLEEAREDEDAVDQAPADPGLAAPTLEPPAEETAPTPAPKPTRTCEVCGGLYQSSQPNRRSCGEACARELNRLKTRELRRKIRAGEFVPMGRPRRKPPVELERSQVAGAPFPVSAPRSDTPDRELYCAHYDDCLDVAVKLDWEGWSCSDCPIRGSCNVAPEPPRGASVALMAIDAADQAPATRGRKAAAGRREV